VPELTAAAEAPIRQRIDSPSAGAAVAAVAFAVPDAVIENREIAERLGVDDEWIVARTGIEQRHRAARGERLADLAAAAGRGALADCSVDAGEIDLVLVGTITQDELVPSTAPQVAGAVGATGAGAIDVGAGCCGFISAFVLGAAQIEAQRARNVLVIGADMLSRITAPDDRTTAALFGDGAGAAVLTAVDPPGAIGPAVLGSDANGAGCIVAARPVGPIEMQGRETFEHAVRRLVEVTREATLRAGTSCADIDLFVYHQANARILRSVGMRLGIGPERVVNCIDRYGNTSAAAIPIALAVAQAEGRLEAGSRVLLGAFGAGFTWGALVLEWGGA
jgi:3-oxoacyl-[acyl-carrier-protein] synthase-3